MKKEIVTLIEEVEQISAVKINNVEDANVNSIFGYVENTTLEYQYN